MKKLFGVAAITVVFVGACTFQGGPFEGCSSLFRIEVLDSFAVPGSSGGALSFDGTDLWMQPWGSGTLCRMDRQTGAVLETVTLNPAVSFAGPPDSWAIDDGAGFAFSQDRIFFHPCWDLVGVFFVDRADPISPSSRVAVFPDNQWSFGMCWGGGFLYIVDQNGLITKVDDNSFATSRVYGYDQYAYQSTCFTAICYDGTDVYVVAMIDASVSGSYDAADANSRMYRVDPSTGTELSRFVLPWDSVTGLASDGQCFYAVDYETNKMYRFALTESG
jgi:hypothetical protein